MRKYENEWNCKINQCSIAVVIRIAAHSIVISHAQCHAVTFVGDIYLFMVAKGNNERSCLNFVVMNAAYEWTFSQQYFYDKSRIYWVFPNNIFNEYLELNESPHQQYPRQSIWSVNYYNDGSCRIPFLFIFLSTYIEICLFTQNVM